MDRRSIILLLIGILASLAGFGATAYLRQDRCTDMGGRWRAVTRECALESGDLVSTARPTDALAGAFVAVVLGFMLVRVATFANSRVTRPPQSQT